MTVIQYIEESTPDVRKSVSIDNPLPVSMGVGAGATLPNLDLYDSVPINLNAGADQQLIAAPGAGKQIWVYGYHFMVNVAGTVSFQDADDTAKSGIMPFDDKGGAICPPSGNPAMPIWKLATNKALEVDVVTSELDGWLVYGIVSV